MCRIVRGPERQNNNFRVQFCLPGEVNQFVASRIYRFLGNTRAPIGNTPMFVWRWITLLIRAIRSRSAPYWRTTPSSICVTTRTVCGRRTLRRSWTSTPWVGCTGDRSGITPPTTLITNVLICLCNPVRLLLNLTLTITK